MDENNMTDVKVILKIVGITAIVVGIIAFLGYGIYYKDKQDKEIGNIIHKAMTNNDSQESKGTTEYIDGFEIAEYEKFNSYASENGLSGTFICIEGQVLNIGIMDTIIEFTVEQPDGNRWTVGVPTKSDSVAKIVESLIGMNVRVFGTYTGYSDLFNLPAMAIEKEDSQNTDKARIEKLDNGEYVTMWPLADSKMDESTEQGQSAEEQTHGSQEEQTENESNVLSPTIGQKNALNKAKEYLEIMAFSYSGLIEQLEFDKFSSDEATYAADNCGADWNEQAAKKAKTYMEIMSLSKDGLIDQLKFDGFTTEQATYGAEQNGY